MPKVSIIIPVYNVEKYLETALNCIQKQTFQDFEVICVDDGSTDRSTEILQKFVKKDKRFAVFKQENRGAGAARNFGLSKARGEYVIFLDGDDLFSRNMLKKALTQIEKTAADICAFNFSQFDEDGNFKERIGIHLNWLDERKEVFNYKDCPNSILSVINPTPWNKLYRAEFIKKNNLKFEEISSSNDITFAAVSSACAEKITYVEDSLMQYRRGHSGTITATKPKKLHNVIAAVSSVVRQAKALPYGKELIKSIHNFAIDNYVFALKNNVPDFNDENAKHYYEHIHEYFCLEEFKNLEPQDLQYEQLFKDFCIVRKHDYKTMQKLLFRKLIVSLTSYPARIGFVAQALETIYAQSKKADDVLLWLAEEQFPNKENDLPAELRQFEKDGKLTVRWCDDLMPHKKYFYALQEYKDDLVVTIDDDMLYQERTLERLYQSYLLNPNSVSTLNAHLIPISEQGHILPYDYWIKNTDTYVNVPSMQIFAVGCLGILYPPNVFPEKLFDKELVKELCLTADDLWLKVMELASDVPVVVASTFGGLHYVPDSQETALWHINLNQNQNDFQFAKIFEWFDKNYGEDFLVKKLTNQNVEGTVFLGTQAICECWQHKIGKIQGRLLCAREEKRHIENSRSYKLGRCILWFPRKVRGGVRCLKENGFKYTVKHFLEKIKMKLQE